jgi:hypothetical protein
MATSHTVHTKGLTRFVFESDRCKLEISAKEITPLIDIRSLTICRDKDNNRESVNHYYVHEVRNKDFIYPNSLCISGRRFVAAKIKNKEVFVISGKVSAAKGLVYEKERSIAKLDSSTHYYYADIFNANRRLAIVIITYISVPCFIDRFDIMLIDKRTLDDVGSTTLIIDNKCNYVLASLTDVPERNCVLITMRNEIDGCHDILIVNKVPLFVRSKVSRVEEIKNGQAAK